MNKPMILFVPKPIDLFLSSAYNSYKILTFGSEVEMQTTRLSSKGQVIIPKPLRIRYNLNSGQKLSVIDTGDGILLRPSRPFKKTDLEHVAGILKYTGKPVSIEEMNAAIKKGALEHK